MISRHLRALQSRFPFIRPAKFEAYNLATRVFGWRVEPEFKLLARFAPVELALDVGGNWGQSIHALQRTARPRRVISFEPNPVLARRLEKRFRNNADVAIQRSALGEVPGTFDLFVPRYGSYVYDGLASLDEASARTWLNADRLAGFRASRLAVERYHVEVRTLDSWSLAPDVVKIDVQGLEMAVVKGGWNTFKQSLPITIVEAPTDDLVELLAGIGMRAYRVAGAHLISGDTGGINTLFLHDSRSGPVRGMIRPPR